ncbi:hypothetical protein [Subtercola frigoramans]|uniref:Bacterial spore germination immunoglobulin-like domain-containing protein n=1 Tax=Subtercola frigoramans TaxID=120298 RepID=A0ABS2L871_9MICO|nr:hypothetical protein [Subtercola frigoramans]MBM7473295.1 hypothetical protein [Subtercola frigoramans]
METNARSRWWIWAIIGVVLVAALVVAFVLVLPRSASAPAPTASASAGSTSPPTSAVPTVKPTSTVTPTVTPTTTVTPTRPPVSAVTPFIASAGWDAGSAAISVSAFVPQIVESDGSCTITATSGSVTVRDAFPATASATTTDCGSNSLASPNFTSGTWQVVVSYSSSTSSGDSAPTEVVIP